jgi:carbon monoxide dehydrogenase subunit G
MYDKGSARTLVGDFVELRHEFRVAAEPQAVYAFLLDVNRVVGCMPGAELSEVVDPSTFTGKVKVKAGPVTASYDGIARILSRDDAHRIATLEAEGKELRGGGSAKATATMSVVADGDGSKVEILVEYYVRGRIAQFGRGVMEEVSRMLLDQMAQCIAGKLVAVPEAAPFGSDVHPSAGSATTTPSKHGAQQDNSVNGLRILRMLIRERVRRLLRLRSR